MTQNSNHESDAQVNDAHRQGLSYSRQILIELLDTVNKPQEKTSPQKENKSPENKSSESKAAAKPAENNPEEEEPKKLTWKDRESQISAVVKLIQMLTRLIPLERKVLGLDEEEIEDDFDDDDEELTEEDIEILSHYVKSKKSKKEKVPEEEQENIEG